jgi:hypothetical protein
VCIAVSWLNIMHWQIFVLAVLHLHVKMLEIEQIYGWLVECLAAWIISWHSQIQDFRKIPTAQISANSVEITSAAKDATRKGDCYSSD